MAHELDGTSPPPSLREQRRAELRQRLSDTATALFLERGFDAVKVVDIARACGVTEKTVFNHFPSKESLLVDRWEAIMTAARAQVGDSSSAVLDGIVATLDDELDTLTLAGKASQEHMSSMRGFGALIATTPALQDHRRRSQQQLAETLLLALTDRWHTHQDDPEAQITAEALSGMFTVFYRSLASHAEEDAARCRRHVRADVRRAARRLTLGISR